MSGKKQVVSAMIDQLCELLRENPHDELSGWDKANQIAHVTLEDKNLTDQFIVWELLRISQQRKQIIEEALKHHKLLITDADINIVVGFLRFLQTIPEDLRDTYEGEEE